MVLGLSMPVNWLGSHKRHGITPQTETGKKVLRMRIREIANARPRFGYERIHVLLQREGWHINVKRVHRLYCL